MDTCQEMAVWEKAVKEVVDLCTNKLKSQPKDELLLKAKASCDALVALPKFTSSPVVKTKEGKSTLEKWIRQYAQAVLDITFYEENSLVDADFPASTCKDSLQAILDKLRNPEKLLSQVPDTQPIQLLGVELVECLLWRQGALFYMYCCTIQQAARIDEDKPFYLKCAVDGVKCLQKMLSVRLPPKKSDFCHYDKEALGLLQQGAYSDTHVIAMVYAGELCYWYHQNADKKSSTSESPFSTKKGSSSEGQFNASSTGKKMLTAYLKIVEGPLKDHGWQSKRAKELLVSLKK